MRKRWIWLGVLVGVVFLGLSELEFKWFAVLFAGLLLASAALFFVDKKYFFLMLLVLALPINININLYYQPSDISRSTYGFQIILFHLPLLALYALWLIRAILARQSLAICSTGLLALAGLLLAASISVLLSINPLFGSFDLFSLFLSILLYCYVASQIRTRTELILVLVLLLVNVAVQGIIALGQHVTNSNLGLDFLGATRVLQDYASLLALSRAGGTLGHPNSLALFFDLTLPLTFSLLFVPMSNKRRFGILLVLGLGLAGLTVTLSRGGIMAVGLALIIIAAVQLSRRLGKLQALAYVLSAILLTGVLILGTENPIQKRFLQHDYGTALGRIPHMQVALNVIRSNPWFGVGLNNYVEAAFQYDTTPQQIMAQWRAPVHNLYLFIIGEIGLVGMAMVLLFTLSVLRAAWPALKSSDPLFQASGLGVLAGLGAYFFHSQFDYAHWSHFTALWFMFGLAVTLGRMAPPPTPQPGAGAL